MKVTDIKLGTEPEGIDIGLLSNQIILSPDGKETPISEILQKINYSIPTVSIKATNIDSTSDLIPLLGKLNEHLMFTSLELSSQDYDSRVTKLCKSITLQLTTNLLSNTSPLIIYANPRTDHPLINFLNDYRTKQIKCTLSDLKHFDSILKSLEILHDRSRLPIVITPTNKTLYKNIKEHLIKEKIGYIRLILPQYNGV